MLERQCSLVKHCLAYHTNTQSMYDEHLNDWLDVAKSRERLPDSVETMFATKLRVSEKLYKTPALKRRYTSSIVNIIL